MSVSGLRLLGLMSLGLATTLALGACTAADEPGPLTDTAADNGLDEGSETGDGDSSTETETETETETGSDPGLGERPALGFACDSTPVATGLSVDDVVPDVAGVDQWGEELSLYGDLCDRTVLLVRAGFDCGECNQEAPNYAALHELYGPEGFIVLTMLHDSAGPIGLGEQQTWASVHGIGHPVVLDNDFALSDTYWPGFLGRPRTKLLGPGAVVIRDEPSLEDIAAQFE